MGLVSYSDSEESDPDERSATSKSWIDSSVEHLRTTSDGLSSKVAADCVKPRKLLINLSEVSEQNEHLPFAQTVEELAQRPVKRTRTDGSFTSFNSSLPRPQNNDKATKAALENTNKSMISRNNNTGIKSGINLMTGSTASFERNSVQKSAWSVSPEDRYSSFHQFGQSRRRDRERDTTSLPITDPTKLVGEPTMFKPLSVGRKPLNQKRVFPKVISSPTSCPERADSTSHTDHDLEQTRNAQTQRKTPLFPSFNEVASDSEESKFEEMGAKLHPRQEGARESFSEQDPVIDRDDTGRRAWTNLDIDDTPNADLRLVANGVGLTDSQKRQFFGRDRNVASAIVTNFSLAEEYSRNNRLIETQATIPAYYPVRSIAPGKHSLQQLVNAATSQKDALEKSFASGKRNRKDAGSRYGW